MSTKRVPVIMPRLGESIVEGTLVAWRAAPGDEVHRGEVLAEVETDKATSEIFAPADGVLETPEVAEGTTVEVGTVLAELIAEGPADEPETGTPSTPESAGAAPASGTSGARASGARTAPASPPAVSPSRPRADGFGDGAPFGWSDEVSPGRLPTPKLADRPRAADGGPARSSPAVRRLAREHDVDLQRLTGSGAQGRVTKQDVLDALATPAPSRPAAGRVPPPGEAYRLPSYQPTDADTVEPFTRRRAQVADHMTTSLATAAHVVAVTEIDMRRVLDAKRCDGAHPGARDVKLSLTAYVVHALAAALAEHPRLNASVRGRELVLRGERNIGVAVDTEAGLVVPVVRRADELGLVGIARRLGDLARAAREGSLRPEDVQGGSFTLSNPGPDGNLFGVSVIRQPEVAILRTGAVVKRAVVRTIDGEDAIVIRPMMYAALSYDHRVIDGRAGNAFLRAVVERLERMQPRLASGPGPV